MLYNPTTGKRIKEPFSHITWVHKAIEQPEFNLQQCYFGEHLLKGYTKPIAIVESEKTAIIASVYLPQFIWLACGSLTNLNADKCKVLKGRSVILYPDLNGFDEWKAKAQELASLAHFTVSDLLERKATEAEKQKGLDLADFLIKFNYKDFIEPEPLPLKQQPPSVQTFATVRPLEPIKQPYQFTKHDKPQPVSWDPEIKELEKFFAGVRLPKQPVKFNEWLTIADILFYIETHFATLKANDGNKTFLPFLDRLQGLKLYLMINSN